MTRLEEPVVAPMVSPKQAAQAQNGIPADTPLETATAEQEVAKEEDKEEEGPTVVEVHGPRKELIKLQFTASDTVSDIRVILAEQPATFYYLAYDLVEKAKGEQKVVQDWEQIGSLPRVLTLVERHYNENEARLSMLRLLEQWYQMRSPSHTYGYNAAMSWFSSIDRSCLRQLLVEETPAEEVPTKAGKKSRSKKAKKSAAAKTLASADALPAAEASKMGMLTPPSLDRLFGSTPLQALDRQLVKRLQLAKEKPTLRAMQLGTFFYLDFVSLENASWSIRAHRDGFTAVARNEELQEAALHLLLQRLSPLYAAKFDALRTALGQSFDAYEWQMVQNNQFPWCVDAQSMSSEGRGDVAWRPDLYHDLQLYSVPQAHEILSREWNETYQSHLEAVSDDSYIEKCYQERLIAKLYKDFEETSVLAVMAVMRGDVASMQFGASMTDGPYSVMGLLITPINDERKVLEEMQYIGGDEVARVNVNKDLQGMRAFHQAHWGEENAALAASKKIRTLLTCTVEFGGKLWLSQAINATILRRVYDAMVWGTKEMDDETSPVAHTLPKVQREVLTSADFEERLASTAKALRLPSHVVRDPKSGQNVSISLSGDCKGFAGDDGRFYILELARLNLLDPYFEGLCRDIQGQSETEQSLGAYPHSLPTFRPALSHLYASHARAKQDTEEAKEEEEPKTAEEDTLSFHPDTRIPWLAVQEDEEAQKAMQEGDKQLFALQQFLKDTIIPKFVRAVCLNGITPLDGTALTELVHNSGINVRYLGTILEETRPFLSSQVEHTSRYGTAKWLSALVQLEMITRAIKHVWRERLAKTGPYALLSTAAELLNLTFGFAPSTEGEAFRTHVLRHVARRFRYQFPEDTPLCTKAQRLPLLRRLCLIFGLQIKAKANATEEAFSTADIASFRPVVSSARINPTMSDLLYAQARGAIDQKDVKGAIQYLYEAVVQTETTDGVGSSELAQIYTTIYQLLDDKEHAFTAIDCCSKAIIAYERGAAGDGGTAVVHTYNALGQMIVSLADGAKITDKTSLYELGLQYMKRSRDMMMVIAGEDHPELPLIDLKLAECLQKVPARSDEVRPAFDMAIQRLERLYASNENGHAGDHNAMVAQALRSKVTHLCRQNAFHEAVKDIRRVHAIETVVYGPTDPRTVEANEFLRIIVQNAVTMKRQASV